MENVSGMNILRSMLTSMYPNGIPAIEEDQFTVNPEIDARRLNKLLLKGCYYPPPEPTKTTQTIETFNELSKDKLKTEEAEKPKEIDVVIETMDGKPFSLSVKPATTIAELQDTVMSTGEFPKNTKRLTFAIKLNGDRNLEGCNRWNVTEMDVVRAALKCMYPNGIPAIEEDQSTIYPVIDAKRLKKLLLKGRQPPPDLANETETTETVHELLEKLKMEDAEKPKEIDVFFETMDGKQFPLTVKPTTTNAELQQDIILCIREVPTSTERLIFSLKLRDDRNLEEAIE